MRRPLFLRVFAASVTCLGDLRLGFSHLSTVVGHSAHCRLPGLGDLRLGFSHLSTVVGHSAHCRLPGLDDLRGEARLLVTPLEDEWKHVVRDRVEDLEELGGDSFAKVNSHFPLVQGVADN